MKFIFSLYCFLLFSGIANAQLQIVDEPNAVALAQKLVGDGITISNVRFTGNSQMAGLFRNIGGTNIRLDSGIVLTTGKARTTDTIALNGSATSSANNELATTSWELPGDTTLANAIGADVDDMNDACVLEFDFVPSGDSIKFRYIFSSEEYEPAFACSDYIDAFGFFISGPGIAGQRNIALVPGTNLPVSILNINNAPDFNNDPPVCPMNPTYYWDNSNGAYFNHDGHTVVLTAQSRVQPCNVYHLKLVISDNTDAAWDSGVFLEAKSLTSNIVTLTNNTQTDASNNSYIVEGCVSGSFTIKRPTAPDYPFSVNLVYAGTAVNGVDMQLLPATVTIPAFDSSVIVNVVPIIDNLPEGIEYIKVYASSGCGATAPIDSTVIQLRDYDTLTITPGNSFICKEASLPLLASSAFSSFSWTGDPGLNHTGIANPIATPLSNSATYICTATVGTCHGKDSVIVRWKELELTSSANVNCKNASTGQVIVNGGTEWSAPVSYSINHGGSQSNGNFNNLPIGQYQVNISDASGCADSLDVEIIQAFPDLLITDTSLVAASCTSVADGRITVTAEGGKPPYLYAINNGAYQSANIFHVGANTYDLSVKDANNCVVQLPAVIVPFINGITLSTSPDELICESESVILQATTNASSVLWRPEFPVQASTLANPSSLTPTASPTVTTKYYVVATLGVCSIKDSVTVNVNPAPVPNAGPDLEVCFGGMTQLFGSGGSIYHWSPATYLSNPDIKDPEVREAATITYQLNVTDTNGCRSLQPDAVLVKVLPPAQLFAGKDTSIAINQPLSLLATDVNHVGFTSYQWSPSKGLNNPFIKNPVAILSDEFNELIVVARTPGNCIGTDTIKINTHRGPEIYVPNSFTPNGDGRNDLLRPLPVGIKSFKIFNVYNRFGQLVFTTSDPARGWDGSFKGVVQRYSSFVWIAQGIDYKGRLVERKGSTMVL